MSLKLSLKPHEKCIIGGAAIQNGNKSATIMIANKTTILREKHILTEKTADTLARQIYFFVQMLYIDGGIDQSKQSHGLFFNLAKQFIDIYSREEVLGLISEIGTALLENDCYRALKFCRELMEVELEYANVA